MEDGTKKAVENIRIGDAVKTDGETAKARNMWSGKEEECRFVRADNGHELIMTKNHPVLTAEGWKQAKEFSQRLGSTDRVNVYESAGDMYITLKITFTIDGDNVDFKVTPDVESAALLEHLGASVEPVELISGGTVEEPVTFDVKLSGLPIYDCACVKPCAWIVQNENLFRVRRIRRE